MRGNKNIKYITKKTKPRGEIRGLVNRLVRGGQQAALIALKLSVEQLEHLLGLGIGLGQHSLRCLLQNLSSGQI